MWAFIFIPRKTLRLEELLGFPKTPWLVMVLGGSPAPLRFLEAPHPCSSAQTVLRNRLSRYP